MIRKIVITALLSLSAASAFAQNAAVVNGKAIPSAKVDEIIARVKKQGQPDTPELRNLIRESLIMTELINQEARKRKLLDKPEVKVLLEETRNRVVANALAQDYLKANPIKDEDVKAEYEKIKAGVLKTPEYRARHILVEKEDEAKDIIAKLKSGAKFEDLAKQSKDPGSAANGGDLDWAVPENYVPEFAAALQKLKKGEVTETPVKTQFGYHVIRLDDTRQAQVPPFEQVQPQIREKMQQQKLGEFQEKLRKSAKVE